MGHSTLNDLAAGVLAAARARGLMITTAESCTGGMIFAALTDIAGSSDVMERGFVTYSNEAKIEMLGVDPSLIATHGAVSEEVASAMAEGALAHSRADLALAVTGVAGPGASEAKPEGLVCFALAHHAQRTRLRTQEFGALGRSVVRKKTVEVGLAMALAALGH